MSQRPLHMPASMELSAMLMGSSGFDDNLLWSARHLHLSVLAHLPEEQPSVCPVHLCQRGAIPAGPLHANRHDLRTGWPRVKTSCRPHARAFDTWGAWKSWQGPYKQASDVGFSEGSFHDHMRTKAWLPCAVEGSWPAHLVANDQLEDSGRIRQCSRCCLALMTGRRAVQRC